MKVVRYPLIVSKFHGFEGKSVTGDHILKMQAQYIRLFTHIGSVDIEQP